MPVTYATGFEQVPQPTASTATGRSQRVRLDDIPCVTEPKRTLLHNEQRGREKSKQRELAVAAESASCPKLTPRWTQTCRSSRPASTQTCPSCHKRPPCTGWSVPKMNPCPDSSCTVPCPNLDPPQVTVSPSHILWAHLQATREAGPSLQTFDLLVVEAKGAGSFIGGAQARTPILPCVTHLCASAQMPSKTRRHWRMPPPCCNESVRGSSQSPCSTCNQTIFVQQITALQMLLAGVVALAAVRVTQLRGSRLDHVRGFY